VRTSGLRTAGAQDPSQLGDDRRVGGQPRDAVELVHREPAQGGVFQGLGHAPDEFGKPYPQYGAAMREGHITAYPVTKGDDNAEFLLTFPDQRVLVTLAGFDLSAWKLPPSGRLRRFGPFATQDPTIDNDGCSDNDQGGCPFAVHGGQACQTIHRSG
jgi:hypothetical protein